MIDEQGHLQPLPDCDWCHKERYGALTIGNRFLTLCEECHPKAVQQQIEKTEEYREQEEEYKRRLKQAKELDEVERFFEMLLSKPDADRD